MLRCFPWIICVLVLITACGAPDPAVPEAPPVSTTVPDTSAAPQASPSSTTAPDASVASQALPAPVEPLMLVRWQEPQTGAFLASVPAGWLAQGNISSSFGLLHPWFDLAEPAGAAAILVGYRQLAFHLLPHPVLDQAGYPAGTAVLLEDGTQMPVTPFQTGEVAAETEARARLQGVCGDLVIVDRRSTGASVSGEVETSEGAVAFECVVEGTQVVGEYHAVTRKLVNPGDGGGIWFSDNAAGYLAQSGYAEQAAGAFEAVLSSFMFDPQWQAGQQAVPDLPGLHYDRSGQSSGASGQFFEDDVFDFCIRNGLPC